jgi:hypothetical protein
MHLHMGNNFIQMKLMMIFQMDVLINFFKANIKKIFFNFFFKQGPCGRTLEPLAEKIIKMNIKFIMLKIDHEYFPEFA